MDYASDSYLTTSLVSWERGENGSDSSRRIQKIEDRGRDLTHYNTQSYSLIHYSYISLQNAAGDVTEALKCINITQSWHGVSGAEHVCAWGVKAAAGDGGAASRAPDESNGSQVGVCRVCCFSECVGIGWVYWAWQHEHICILYSCVFVLHVLSISVCLNMPFWYLDLGPAGHVSAIISLLACS